MPRPRDHPLRQIPPLVGKKTLRALLHTPNTIRMEPRRPTSKIQSPLHTTPAPARPTVFQAAHILAAGDLLKVNLQLLVQLPQPFVFARPDVETEAHGAGHGVRAAGGEGQDAGAGERGVFRGEAVGVEDHFGGGEEGVGAVGEVGGAGVAVAALDGDGGPAVGLHLRRMGVLVCWFQAVAFGLYVRLGRCLSSAFGSRGGVLALLRRMSELVGGLTRSECWWSDWRVLQELNSF